MCAPRKTGAKQDGANICFCALVILSSTLALSPGAFVVTSLATLGYLAAPFQRLEFVQSCLFKEFVLS